MRTAEQMIQAMGKEKFVETIKNAPKNSPTKHDRSRGIKGRIKHRRCQHGVWVIEDYEPKKCDECAQERTRYKKSRDFRPTFNMGLGCWVESRSEEKQIAKSMGLEEAG